MLTSGTYIAHYKSMKTYHLICVCLILILSGCKDQFKSSIGKSSVRDQRQKWIEARKNIVSYELTTRISCFCAPNGLWTLRVQVGPENEILEYEGLDYYDNPIPNLVLSPYNLTSVERLFEVLEDAENQGAESISVTYGLEYGFPISYFIDHSTMMADEESGASVVDFRVLEWAPNGSLPSANPEYESSR